MNRVWTHNSMHYTTPLFSPKGEVREREGQVCVSAPQQQDRGPLRACVRAPGSRQKKRVVGQCLAACNTLQAHMQAHMRACIVCERVMDVSTHACVPRCTRERESERKSTHAGLPPCTPHSWQWHASTHACVGALRHAGIAASVEACWHSSGMLA